MSPRETSPEEWIDRLLDTLDFEEDDEHADCCLLVAAEAGREGITRYRHPSGSGGYVKVEDSRGRWMLIEDSPFHCEAIAGSFGFELLDLDLLDLRHMAAAGVPGAGAAAVEVERWIEFRTRRGGV